MLELQHISFGVEQDGEDKNILRDINLTIHTVILCINQSFKTLIVDI